MVYVIGDIQGCYRTFQKLLDKIGPASSDELWFVGDLVNRGPRSVEVLDWFLKTKMSTRVVLGNHDIWLLCRYALNLPKGKKDTLDPVLQDPRMPEWANWLRKRRLLHIRGGWTMVHAGVHPSWNERELRIRALRVEKLLRGPEYADFLQSYSRFPQNQKNPSSKKFRKECDTLRILTNIRACNKFGRFPNRFTSGLTEMPKGYRAWFEFYQNKPASRRIIFGHWAALGLYLSKMVVGVDSGCVWGGSLTAYGLQDGSVHQAKFDD